MSNRSRRQDLAYGIGRRLSSPLANGHDTLVRRLHAALDEHVTSRCLGRSWANMEVVLDQREGLILQPDISFIVDGRESIVSDRVWGAPDMVLEVTSPFEHSGELEERVAWFSLYGVREYLAGAAGDGHRDSRARARRRSPAHALRRHHADSLSAAAGFRSLSGRADLVS